MHYQSLLVNISTVLQNTFRVSRKVNQTKEKTDRSVNSVLVLRLYTLSNWELFFVQVKRWTRRAKGKLRTADLFIWYYVYTKKIFWGGYVTKTEKFLEPDSRNVLLSTRHAGEPKLHWDTNKLLITILKDECSLTVLSQYVYCSPAWKFCTTWLTSWKGSISRSLTYANFHCLEVKRRNLCIFQETEFSVISSWDSHPLSSHIRMVLPTE